MLPWLHDLKGKGSGRVGRHFRINHDAQRVRLSLLHQLHRHEYLFRGDMVGGADFVVRSPAGWYAIIGYAGLAYADESQGKEKGTKYFRNPVHASLSFFGVVFAFQAHSQ